MGAAFPEKCVCHAHDCAYATSATPRTIFLATPHSLCMSVAAAKQTVVKTSMHQHDCHANGPRSRVHNAYLWVWLTNRWPFHHHCLCLTHKCAYIINVFVSVIEIRSILKREMYSSIHNQFKTSPGTVWLRWVITVTQVGTVLIMKLSLYDEIMKPQLNNTCLLSMLYSH